MNIFVLDKDPYVSARMMCDKHVPKMVVESAQMMASALRRHGATDDQMPLTQKGTPYKGGYANHPCTVWVGETHENFDWLCDHAYKLLCEYWERFGKEHACTKPIMQMYHMSEMIPEGEQTPFALAMPDEYRPVACHINNGYLYHARGDTATKAYRDYYRGDKARFAKWDKGTPAPEWW